MRNFTRLNLAIVVFVCVFFCNVSSVTAQREVPPPVDGGGGDGDCCVNPASTIPLPQRVLVIYNTNVPESFDVANYYMTRRAIPSSNLLGISFSGDTEISWSEYFNGGVRNAIINKLNSLGSSNIL